jgi:hypothetical protein
MGPLALRVAMLALLAVSASAATAAGPRDALNQARQLYNARKFDEAIEAARAAAAAPNLADSANIVIARAYLERFRQSAEPSDLETARDTLAQVKTAQLRDDDRLDLAIALGQSLYFDDKAGAAAEQFDIALGRTAGEGNDEKRAGRRELVLDWWASALDRQAQVVSVSEARAIETRIVSRMEEALRADPDSMVASYWLVAAARGTGDVERAWSAAIAGWVRAAQAGRRGVSLQTDLNRFVTQVIIPERSRQLSANNPDAAAAAMRKEWDSLKQAWVTK